jgi:hypothetical protein
VRKPTLPASASAPLVATTGPQEGREGNVEAANGNKHEIVRGCPSSGILNTRQHNFSVSVLRKGPNRERVSPSPPPDLPKRRVFYFLEYWTMGKVKSPVIVKSRGLCSNQTTVRNLYCNGVNKFSITFLLFCILCCTYIYIYIYICVCEIFTNHIKSVPQG